MHHLVFGGPFHFLLVLAVMCLESVFSFGSEGHHSENMAFREKQEDAVGEDDYDDESAEEFPGHEEPGSSNVFLEVCLAG